MANTDSNAKTQTKQSPRLIAANSHEAYALWARRVGSPLFSYTQQHVGWAIRCPACGRLTLLEIVFDSENGAFFKSETCQCGGGR